MITDEAKIAKIQREYFQLLLQDQEEFNYLKKIKGTGIPTESLSLNLFYPLDILTYVYNSDFTKGLGPDYFNGEIFKASTEVRNSYCAWAVDLMNGKTKVSEYLSETRFIPLSKTSKSECKLEDIKGIVVNSHIVKAIDQTILDKLKSLKSDLLKVQTYQTGF